MNYMWCTQSLIKYFGYVYLRNALYECIYSILGRLDIIFIYVSMQVLLLIVMLLWLEMKVWFTGVIRCFLW